MEGNPAYHCTSKEDDVKDHQYEVVDNAVSKSRANKSNTRSN